MAEQIVLQNESSLPKEAQDWESHFYQRACKQARQEAMVYLQGLDDKLLEQKPEGWQVVGKRRRTLVTRFGEICIERRLYRDREGVVHFWLDEYVGLLPQQAATPEVEETLVGLAAEVSYEQAAKHLERMTAGVLSKSTVGRLVGSVGKRALEAAEKLRRGVYEHGNLPEPGKQRTEWLYVEGDGVWVRLQGRQGEKWTEICLGIAYEGWEALPGKGERYRLQNKRVYVHGNEKTSFWEGALTAWYQVWDFDHMRWVVLNGDDAGWIGKGKECFENVIRQQDGFHVARTCQRAFEKEEGRKLYEALRQGKTTEANTLWVEGRRREGKQAQRALRWLEKHLQDGELMDWRLRLEQSPPQARSLGGMEGNNAHLIAERMKGKGRSWSILGALAMAKVQELVSNDELSLYCRRSAASLPVSAQHPPQQSERKSQPDSGEWLQGRIPALHHRIPSDPALLRLKQSLSPYLLN